MSFWILSLLFGLFGLGNGDLATHPATATVKSGAIEPGAEMGGFPDPHGIGEPINEMGGFPDPHG